LPSIAPSNTAKWVEAVEKRGGIPLRKTPFPVRANAATLWPKALSSIAGAVIRLSDIPENDLGPDFLGERERFPVEILCRRGGRGDTVSV